MNTWRRRETARGEAVRVKMRPWADPRLLGGVLLVVAATVMGGRMAATSDEVTQYWSLDRDVSAGQRVQAAHLRPVRVDVARGTSRHLVDVDHRFERPLADSVWAADGQRGELLTPDALTSASKVSLRELPVRVESGAAPGDLRAGERVDVWASAQSSAGHSPTGSDASETAGASLVVRNAWVRAVDASATLGATERTVVLGLDADAVTPEVVASVGHAKVTLVRVP